MTVSCIECMVDFAFFGVRSMFRIPGDDQTASADGLSHGIPLTERQACMVPGRVPSMRQAWHCAVGHGWVGVVDATTGMDLAWDGGYQLHTIMAWYTCTYTCMAYYCI